MKVTGRLIDPTGGDVVMPRSITRDQRPLAMVAEVVFALVMNAGSKGAFDGNPVMKLQVDLDGRVIFEQTFGQRRPFRIQYQPEDAEDEFSPPLTASRRG